MNLTCFLAFFTRRKNVTNIKIHVRWFLLRCLLKGSIILNEGVVVRASKYFTIVSFAIHWICLLRSCQYAEEIQTGGRRALRWGLPNSGIQGASDSVQTSLQPFLLPKVLLGKENEEKKTWEPWPVDTVLLSMQELFRRGIPNTNAELLSKLHARTAA